MAAVAVKSLLQIEKGSPYPLGATPDQNGVNFSLFSENATGVELMITEGIVFSCLLATIQ